MVKIQQILTFHKLPSALWLSKRSAVHCLSAYNPKKKTLLGQLDWTHPHISLKGEVNSRYDCFLTVSQQPPQKLKVKFKKSNERMSFNFCLLYVCASEL